MLKHNGLMHADETNDQERFFDLAERFRSAEQPEEIQRLGDELGRLIFG